MRNVSIVCGFNQELLRITRENISSYLDSDNLDPLRDLKNLFNYENAHISAQDNQGNTALHFACKNCNYDIAKYLIEEKNARINVKNKDGKTPLDLANECQQSQKEQIVELFKKTQLKLDMSLLINIREGNLTKVRSLVSKGANINAQDTQNQYGDTWTSLHHASRNGHLEVARYLIENGAYTNAKDNGDEIPLDFAKKRDHSDIVEYLEKIKEDRERSIHRPRRSVGAEDEVGKEESLKMEREEVLVAASDATKPSSWINGSFGLIKSFIGGLIGLSSSAEEVSNATPQFEFKEDVPNSTTLFDSTSTKQESDYTGWNFFQDLFQGFIQNNVNYVDANLKQARERQMPIKFEPKNDAILEMGDYLISQIDGNGALHLLDMFIRKIKGTKPLSFKNNDISELAAQGYALKIIEKLKDAINQSANKSGISAKQLKYDSVKIYNEIKGKIISNKLTEIPEILKSHAVKALSQKLAYSQLEKFNKEINARLNSLVQQITFSDNSTSIDNKQCSTNNTVNQSSIFKRIVDKNSNNDIDTNEPTSSLNNISVINGNVTQVRSIL